MADGGNMKVERCTFDSYQTYLQDKHRPPSRGGNTRAWHSHVLKIGGEAYSFFALGAKKWAYVGDTISFEWSWDESRRYRNVDPKTFRTWAKDGTPVERGIRGFKPWRTAGMKAPLSRVQRRDDDADFYPANCTSDWAQGASGESGQPPLPSQEITEANSETLPAPKESSLGSSTN